MKICARWQVVLSVLLCGLMMSAVSSAQSYIRYVNPEDLGSEKLYADSVLSSITLPRGVSKLYNYPKFNLAALKLSEVMSDPSKEIMQVYVCGSASPDGLWADNVKLSQARTDAAAEYLTSILDIPSYMIHKKSLNEDWNRLYELVAASDLPYKYTVMTIIKSMDWSDRKKALQAIDGGKAWEILERDFFPQLRCVRFAIFCKWDPSKPYMTAPKEVNKPLPAPVSDPQLSKVDTVYVRDTVIILKETTYMPQVVETPAIQTVVAEVVPRQKKVWDTPWMMGLKTNLISDVLAIPALGVEVQLADRLSLGLSGWYTGYNIFNPSDSHTNVYGFSPEIRWWVRDRAMERGSFFGIHARLAWYTMQWADGYLYQNGMNDDYNVGAGNDTPAWSVGLTLGHSFALDKKARWGLEFVLGLGYGQYRQNLGVWNEENETWNLHEYQDNTHIGITRAGINLTYRFSTRRVNPDYYKDR